MSMSFPDIALSLLRGEVHIIKKFMNACTNGYQVYDPFVDPIALEPNGTTESKTNLFRFKDEDFANKSVSDLGCNLGAFSFIALNKGASKVFSYEMDSNFKKFLDLLIHNYVSRFPKYHGKMEAIQLNLNTLPPIQKTDVVLCVAIIHWFFAFNPTVTMAEIAKWLSETCGETLYFEGCVTASEPVMQTYNVDLARYNENLFMDEMSKYFTVKIIGRPSYNKNRLVAKFYKK